MTPQTQTPVIVSGGITYEIINGQFYAVTQNVGLRYMRVTDSRVITRLRQTPIIVETDYITCSCRAVVQIGQQCPQCGKEV